MKDIAPVGAKTLVFILGSVNCGLNYDRDLKKLFSVVKLHDLVQFCA